jgi:hypothetical protein
MKSIDAEKIAGLQVYTIEKISHNNNIIQVYVANLNCSTKHFLFFNLKYMVEILLKEEEEQT